MSIDATQATPRSKTARGRDRRRQILETATRLFSERGYVQTSLIDIADQIGITGPAIYYYYNSKDDILLEIRERIIEESIARVQDLLTEERPPREAMEIILRSHIETVLDNVEANIVFDRERGHLSDEREQAQRSKERQYERYLRQIHQQGVAEGQFHDLDSALAVGTLLAGCNWTCHLGKSRSKRVVVDTVVDLLLRSISRS